MKKTVLTLLLGCSITSCVTTDYVQVIDVQSKTVTENENNFVYENDNCKILYYFWREYGDAGFSFENKSDEILYVNLEQSFFTRNGMAYDYFLNRSWSQGKSSISMSGNMTSANVYGIWAMYRQPGSNSFTKTTGSSVGSMSNITYEEKAIVCIPPHNKKYFGEYHILGDVVQDCSMKLFPKRRQKTSMRFQADESPISFGNYITYKVGENGIYSHITNDFYVSQVSNYKMDDAKEKIKIGCHEQIKIETNKYQKGTRFFILYDNKHNNDYSEDAKEFHSNQNNEKFWDILY